MDNRLGFGVFLAPHHPIGEHPMLQLERDLELATLLDGLGYDEFWVGEHHSGGWETIASPEMFLAAAAQRTQRIKLGTGVVSIPYHHPFTVAQRMVMLDMLSRGRAMLGVGPGALPSDAFMLGIDPMTQRDQMDEGLGVIIRLLNEREPITVDGSWYLLRDAALHLRPLQKQMPIAVASMISPAGMKAAGKYGVGVLSVASYMQEGLTALKTQWSFAESSAKEHGKQVDRANWRIVMPFHLADSKEQAYRDVRHRDMPALSNPARWNGMTIRQFARSTCLPCSLAELSAKLHCVLSAYQTLLHVRRDRQHPHPVFARGLHPGRRSSTRPLSASAFAVAADAAPRRAAGTRIRRR